jgi:hypothetical protein
MKKISWSFWLLLVSSLLLTGCTTTITNLTPSTQKRSPSGLYPFEIAIDTREYKLRQGSLQPYVLIGTQAYPMQPTFMLTNRWETLVPISPDKEFVSYHFKINYLYNSIGRPEPSSRLSPPAQLHILDR